MRITAMILGALPFLVAVGFAAALNGAGRDEGMAVALSFIFACIVLAAMSLTAVVMSFARRPPSGLDIPSRVISIASAVFFVPAGGFGLLLAVMMMFPPAVNV